MLPIDLSGKLALVTGATGELGRVMVRTLARAGADVAVHYHRNADLAKKLVAEARGVGRRAAAVQADLTGVDAVAAMRDTVGGQLGPPDIVVSNAIIQYAWKTVLEQDLADYESQFRSSVLQNVLLAKMFVPAMIDKKWGRIIGVSTECLMQCAPNQSAYISGKGAADRLWRVLAREVGLHGITVNQVAPGWTVSETRPGEGRPATYLDTVPLRRWGTDLDVANAVAFLASDLAGFITGAYIPVSGGTVMPAV